MNCLWLNKVSFLHSDILRWWKCLIYGQKSMCKVMSINHCKWSKKKRFFEMGLQAYCLRLFNHVLYRNTDSVNHLSNLIGRNRAYLLGVKLFTTSNGYMLITQQIILASVLAFINIASALPTPCWVSLGVVLPTDPLYDISKRGSHNPCLHHANTPSKNLACTSLWFDINFFEITYLKLRCWIYDLKLIQANLLELVKS